MSKFTSAKLHSDGVQCVFTLHKFVIKRAQGIAAYPDGGIPKYVKDAQRIGVVNIKTGKSKILVHQKNEASLPGHWNFEIKAIQANRVLLFEEGQAQTRKHFRRWWILDIETGDFVFLDIENSFTEESKNIKRVFLFDHDLILLEVGGRYDLNKMSEIWIREPDGNLSKWAKNAKYEGEYHGDMMIYENDLGVIQRVDPLTSQKTIFPRTKFKHFYNYEKRQKPQNFCAIKRNRPNEPSKDKFRFGKKLEFGYDVKGERVYKNLKIKPK